ncbi:hypothetical protein ABZX42_15210 [Streptomyces sp. NPDC004611]|uniref:hypothetical protein n=1 Tax=Streptomyces sp. NPDC004611 TaxID=3154669 RepID=UPI0033A61701
MERPVEPHPRPRAQVTPWTGSGPYYPIRLRRDDTVSLAEPLNVQTPTRATSPLRTRRAVRICWNPRRSRVPLFPFSVSGEFRALTHVDPATGRRDVRLLVELFTMLKRAGASASLTYAALDIARGLT